MSSAAQSRRCFLQQLVAVTCEMFLSISRTRKPSPVLRPKQKEKAEQTFFVRIAAAATLP